MKKITSIIIIYIISISLIYALPKKIADLKPVEIYKTTSDFVIGNKKSAGVQIINKSDQHVFINGIFDLQTGKRLKRDQSYWMIKYDSSYYFNLGFATEINKINVFAKLNIVGKYCAVIIDKNSPSIIKSQGANYGGLVIGAVSDIAKLGRNWNDSTGNWKRILFIDTREFLDQYESKIDHNTGNYLTKEQLKELIKESGSTLVKEKINDIKYEQVIELIESVNKHSSK